MKKDDPKHYHADMRLSCPFYETDLKILWKKERNRLAAKKSRDKKAGMLKKLEGKEKLLEDQLIELKEALIDYDNVLDKLLFYIESNLHNNDLIVLFSAFCNLKKPSGLGYLRETRIQGCMAVSNERIEEMVKKIRCCLNDMVYKYSG